MYFTLIITKFCYMESNDIDLAASCILGTNVHEIYASLPVERTITESEIKSLLKIVKQLSAVNNVFGVSKFLETLLDSNFPFEKVDSEIYSQIITHGNYRLIKKIVIHLAFIDEKPPPKIVMEVLKAQFDQKDFKFQDIARAIRRWMMWDVWKFVIEELIAANRLKEGEKLLGLLGSGSTSSGMLNCWETFLSACAEKGECDSALTALSKLHSLLQEQDREIFRKLLTYFANIAISKDSFPFGNTRKTLEFVGSNNVELPESNIERALEKLSEARKLNEKDFLSLIQTIKASVTASMLNKLNQKFLEFGRQSLALSLFNLAVNGAFPRISESQVELDTKIMKSLLVCQQKRIIVLQKELEEKRKLSVSEIVSIELEPEKWDEYVLI